MNDFPGQVRPLSFLVPVYRQDRRSAWYIQAGLWMYRALARDPAFAGGQRLSRHEVELLEPALDRKDLQAAFLYDDGQADWPERAALEYARQAEEMGAVAYNHLPATKLLVEGRRVVGVETAAGEFRASLTINAAGAWIDHVRGLLPGERKDLLLTRLNGAHIVLRPFAGAPSRAVYHEARSDGRPFFIVPWRELLLIGTTETPYEGDPDNVTPSAGEVDYLLAETNGLFPDARLTPDDVCYAYCGSRPLVRASAANMNKASREHGCFDHEREEGLAGLLTLIGGKLTTAPSFAREALSAAMAKLGRPAPQPRRRRPGPATSGVVDADRLTRVYGPRAREVKRLLAARPELDLPVVAESPVTVAEILYAVESEKARTLGDILLRRTGLAYHPDYRPEWACQVAETAAAPLHWSDAAVQKHLASFQSELDRTLIRP